MKRPIAAILLALLAAGLIGFAVNQPRWFVVSRGEVTVSLGLSNLRSCARDLDVSTEPVCVDINYVNPGPSEQGHFFEMPGAYRILGPGIYWGGMIAAALLALAGVLAGMGLVMGRLITPPRLALLASVALLGAIVAFAVLTRMPENAALAAQLGAGGAAAGVLAAVLLGRWHTFGAMTAVGGARADIDRWDEGRGKKRPELAKSLENASLKVGSAPPRVGIGEAGTCRQCGSRTHLVEDGRTYCDLCQKFV